MEMGSPWLGAGTARSLSFSLTAIGASSVQTGHLRGCHPRGYGITLAGLAWSAGASPKRTDDLGKVTKAVRFLRHRHYENARQTDRERSEHAADCNDGEAKPKRATREVGYHGRLQSWRARPIPGEWQTHLTRFAW